LVFYKQEVALLEDRIAEIAKRNTATEVLAEVEHFQNQYIRQAEVIDTLRNKINHHVDDLAREYKERPVAVDHRLFTDHTGMREEMDTFESIYGELKRELMRWLAKRM
jgi:cobalamin biosynthesis protein CbiD